MILDNGYITTAGAQFLARADATGKRITWTRCTVTDDRLDTLNAAALRALTALAGTTQDGAVLASVSSVQESDIALSCNVTNEGLLSGLTCYGFGIWAQLDGDLSDTLVFVAAAAGTPTTLNAEIYGLIRIYIDVTLSVSDFNQTQVLIVPGGMAPQSALAATNAAVEANTQAVLELKKYYSRKFKSLSQALGNVEDGEVFCVQPKPLGETVQIQGLVSEITNEVCTAGVLAVGYGYILIQIAPYSASQDPHPYDHYWIAAYKADKLFEGNTTPAKLFTLTGMTEYPVVKDIVKLTVTPDDEEHIFFLDRSETKNYWDPVYTTQSAYTYTLHGIDTNLTIELDHDMAMLQLNWTPCGLFGMYCYPALATDGSVITDAYLKKVLSVSTGGTLVTRYVSQSISVYPSYSLQPDADMLRQIQPFDVQGIVYDGMEIVTAFDILSVNEVPFDSNSVMIAWIDKLSTQNCTAYHLSVTNFKIIPCANRLLLNTGLFDGAYAWQVYDVFDLQTMEQCYGLYDADLSTVRGVDCKGIVVNDGMNNVVRKSLDDYNRKDRAYNSETGWECFCFGFGTGYYNRYTDTLTLKTPSGDFTKMLCEGGKIYPYIYRV